MRSLDFAELRIPLTSIKAGESNFTFETCHPALEIGEGRRFPDVIKIVAKMSPAGSDYLLDLIVKSRCEFICDRCGNLFDRIIEGRVHTLFTFRSEEANVEDDDVRVLDPGTDEIDIRTDVLDALILSVPAKMVCSDSCKGLCPHCGVNLNESTCQCMADETDSRWDALRNLKSNH